MRIEPDAKEAARDQASTIRLLRQVLGGGGGGERLGGEPTTVRDLNIQAYPGLFAAAFEAQTARRSNTADGIADRLTLVREGAVNSAARASRGTCPSWPVDLPPPEAHLDQSLERAKGQVPKRVDRGDELAAMSVRAWTENERAVHCAASCLLRSVWPAMLEEVAIIVRQVALLDGFGIDGFTDFASHGVVFVNAERVSRSDKGLPPAVRLAEAFVHEATHSRCNAAAVSDPFLAEATSDPASLVETPLRNDPRPLAGLFQQLVVIVRSAMLYARLAEGREAVADRADLLARYATLRGQGRQALSTLQAHAGKLSEHGRRVVAGAARLLEDDAELARV